MASGDIIKSEFPMVAVEPWCVRKLVEQAAQYARGLGFARHPDCMKAAWVFGGLRTKQFAWHFTFGREGKPCYCRGPGETEAQARRIVWQLERSRGPGNHDYVVA